MVVVLAPLLDQHLGFGQAVEHLAPKQLVTQLAVEALHVAVLPRTTRLDVSCLGAHALDPILHRTGHKLRPVVRADVRRNPAHDEQVRQHVDDVGRFQPASNPDHQAFAGELIHYVQHPQLASIPGAIFDKVVGPYLVRPLRP